jgi:L-2-hydroxyglutarate oxidase LhgO
LDQADCIVVGAGVIGLSVARELALRGRDVVIIETATAIGSGSSSRNNEVIHAGFLYPVGSLKAALCRRGAHELYDYCRQREVRHQQIGKLVISTSDTDTEVLRRLIAHAPQHGVHDLRFLDRFEARKLEPRLTCHSAIFSPFTGVVDTHGLMLALLADAEGAGATIAYGTRVAGVKFDRGELIALTHDHQGDQYAISCRMLINAAGLGAAEIARTCHGDGVPDVDLAKGQFFSISGPLPLRHLIVPLGETLAMGGAFTIDSAGQGKFGPDLEWAAAIDYSVNPDRRSRFAAAIRRYYPEIDEDRLHSDFAGIRPRLRMKEGAPTDWLILGPSEHGIRGLFHLLGFETPGLTACLAIGKHVADLTMPSRGGHAVLQHH